MFFIQDAVDTFSYGFLYDDGFFTGPGGGIQNFDILVRQLSFYLVDILLINLIILFEADESTT